MKKLFIGVFFALSIAIQAQDLHKIGPESWWVGMQMNTVEFMVYGKDISELIAESKTLEVQKSVGLESPGLIFFDRKRKGESIHVRVRTSFIFSA